MSEFNQSAFLDPNSVDKLEVPPECSCPSCQSGLIRATEWEEVDANTINVTRVCPECDWSNQQDLDINACLRIDAERDRALDEIESDADELAYAIFAEEAEIMIKALQADLIAPEDIIRSSHRS